MELFWDIFFFLIPIWIFVLIPFSTFYYEADDAVPLPAAAAAAAPPVSPIGVDGEQVVKEKKPRSRLSQALCNLAVLLVFVVLFFFLSYWFLSESRIPIRSYEAGTMASARAAGVIYTTPPRKDESTGHVLPFSPTLQLASMQPNDAILSRLVQQEKDLDHVSYQVEVSTFYAGLMAFVGWFFFALFGGIGLAALPLHGILTFVRRPRKMTPEEMEDAKISLQDRVNEMVDIGEQLKREREDKSKSENNKGGVLATLFPTLFQKRSGTLREFKAAVHLLEQDVEDFTAYQTSNEKYNPLYPYLALLMGIISSIFSGCWILHTVLYTLPKEPVVGFLNNLFEWFDTWFPLFGTLSVALFTMYLLLCAIQGCFVFGLRFLCLSFYPMKVGQTYMSSFLFNMGLVLLSALPVVQFAVISFDDYAKYSTIRQIFVVQIEYLDLFSFFYENLVFIYSILIIALMTGIYMVYKNRKGDEGTELRNRLKSRATAARGTTGNPATTATSSMGETGEETFDDEPASDYEDDEEE
jgi:LMBR1 domain-containing protein 1